MPEPQPKLVDDLIALLGALDPGYSKKLVLPAYRGKFDRVYQTLARADDAADTDRSHRR